MKENEDLDFPHISTTREIKIRTKYVYAGKGDPMKYDLQDEDSQCESRRRIFDYIGDIVLATGVAILSTPILYSVINNLPVESNGDTEEYFGAGCIIGLVGLSIRTSTGLERVIQKFNRRSLQ